MNYQFVNAISIPAYSPGAALAAGPPYRVPGGAGWKALFFYDQWTRHTSQYCFINHFFDYRMDGVQAATIVSGRNPVLLI